MEDPITIRLKEKSDCLRVYKDIFYNNTIDFKAKSISKDENITFIEFSLKLNDAIFRGADVLIWKNNKILERRAYVDIPKIL